MRTIFTAILFLHVFFPSESFRFHRNHGMRNQRREPVFIQDSTRNLTLTGEKDTLTAAEPSSESNQLWIFEKRACSIRNFGNENCITLPENGCEKGTIVTTASCNNSDTQSWLRPRDGYIKPQCDSNLALGIGADNTVVLEPVEGGMATVFTLRTNSTR